MRVTVQAKLVVGLWELIPMEPGYDNSEQQDTEVVNKENEERESKRKRTSWWKD